MNSVSERVGRAAMIGSLLKQVILSVLRRSFEEPKLWAQRFPIINDPQIARAFASMIADPCENHTTNTLARVAGLSRSAFMSRFSEALGVSPLAALRELRMRRAANLLDAKMMSVEQVANTVGYVNRSSFSRAFRAIYGVDPTDYRAGKSSSEQKWIEHRRRKLGRRFLIFSAPKIASFPVTLHHSFSDDLSLNSDSRTSATL